MVLYRKNQNGNTVCERRDDVRAQWVSAEMISVNAKMVLEQNVGTQVNAEQCDDGEMISSVAETVSEQCDGAEMI